MSFHFTRVLQVTYVHNIQISSVSQSCPPLWNTTDEVKESCSKNKVEKAKTYYKLVFETWLQWFNALRYRRINSNSCHRTAGICPLQLLCCKHCVVVFGSVSPRNSQLVVKPVNSSEVQSQNYCCVASMMEGRKSKQTSAAADTFLSTNNVLHKWPDSFLCGAVVCLTSCPLGSLSVGEENVHSPEQRRAHQEGSAEGGLWERWESITQYCHL